MIRIHLGQVRRFLLGLLVAPGLAFAADPQIAAFTDTPDPAVAGAVYAYEIRVDNNAVDAAVNTRLTVTVPSGAAFVSASPSSQNCAAVSPTQVQCVLGNLAGNGLDTRTITMNWRATVAGPATINANATVTADNDINPANNAQDQVTTVLQGANLSLAMTDAPDPVAPGANVTYVLTAANPGPNTVGDLLITNNLPPSSSFVSATGSGWSCGHAAGVVTCTRAGPHAAGVAVPPVTIVTTANAASGTITNSATVSSGVGGIPDPDTADNTATANTTILSGADVLILSKNIVSATPITAGTNVTFVLTPRNAGPDVASTVSVTDVLPAGWTFLSAGGTGWSCAAVGQTVTCSRPSLAVGVVNDLTIIATAPALVAEGGTSFINTGTIAAANSDPIPGNNSASVTATVFRDGADLSLSKSKTPFAATVGGALTSSLTVTNNGPRVATGPLRVVEVLTNESFVSGSGTGWSCAAASATVVVCNHANAGGLAVGASLPTLTINTTVIAAGGAINTACTGSSLPSGVGAGVTPLPPTNPGGDPNTTNDCATANSLAVAGAGNADLRVFSVLTTTPIGGDKLISGTESSATFTIKVTNNGPADATGARIDYVVPNFIVGGTLVGAVTAVVGDVNGAPNGSTATFSCTRTEALGRCSQTGGALRTGDFVTVVVTASRPMGRTWGAPAFFPVSVSNTVEFDLDSSNNTGQDEVSVDPIADIQMTGKTTTPTTVLAGENATYVLSYRNNGPDAAFDVALSDTFSFFLADGVTPNPSDPGLEVLAVNSSRPGSGCSVAVGSFITPAANVVTCTIGYMPEGEAHTVTLVVRPASQAANPTRVIRNTGAVTTTSVESPSGGNNGNNSQTSTLTVLSNAIDLLINKTDLVDPVPFVAGSTFINYQTRVTSNGPSFGTNVRITETMTPPAGKRVRFVCDTTTFSGTTCNPVSLCSATNITSATPGAAVGPFTCSVPAGTVTTGANVGELATGQSKDIFLRYEVLDQPPVSGDVFNSAATVSSDQNETFLANNSSVEQTTTRNRIDIRVSKAPSVPTVAVSQPFNWVVTVVNNGPGDSLQTDLTDTLPAGTALNGAISWTRTLPAGSGTCSVTALTVSCALGRLNAAGVATVTIPVRMTSFPTGGTAQNSATVDVDPAKTGADDFPGGNNTGTSTVTVTRSSLSGTVFEDRNRSGANGGTPQAAAGEPRIAGVSLRLTGTDNLGNAVDRTAVTDVDGNFAFADLPPSNGAGYALTQTQPVGFVNGPTDPPVAGGAQPSAGGSYARGGASGNTVYSGIVLGSGVDAVNYNFPEVRLVSLSGFVYVDVNTSNVRDPGTDTPIVGATVRLLDAGSLALVQTTLTDASGAYSFTGLDPLISYTLEEPLPVTAGSLANGPVNPGLVGGAACAAGCTAQANTPSAGTDRIAAIDLSAGQDGTQFNFGEIQVTAISGTVYVDLNGNNTPDPAPADGRLPGVTITLYTGTTCAGAPLSSQLTGPTGDFSFTGLVAGQTYTVCQTQPVGYGDGTVNPGTNGSSGAANAITITGLPVSGSGSNYFGERLGALSGAVYLDANNDGVRQGGESGIAGVSVSLSGTDATGAPVNRTAITNASGAFSFDNLVGSGAGGYTLTEQLAQPVVGGITTLNGRSTAGTVGGSGTGTASAVSTAPSSISGIVLPAGAQSIDNLFGEILPVSISGLVFSDANNNGAQNPPADAGLSGVSIVLTGTDDLGSPVNRPLVTALDGSFSVADLRPGTYTLTQPTQPVGTTNGITTAGSAGGTATLPATTPSAISAIVLTTPGAASTGNLFAEIPDSGVISGQVWLDANNDGVLQGTESGIAGQTIELTGTTTLGATVSRSAVTAADGSFSFSGLAPGTYTLTQPAQPAATFNGQTVAGSLGGTATGVATTPSAISGIVLGALQSSLSNNFGETLSATISGTVYVDLNGNNTPDPAPTDGRLPGVTLTLYAGNSCAGAPLATQVSGATGDYSFAGLVAGQTYTVCQTQPVGYGDGTVNPGTNGSSGAANAITITGLPAGGSSGNAFGERLGALSGAVYLDANNDGVRQGGESGIAGVSVSLSGTDATGAPVNRTAITNASGAFSFDNLVGSGAGGYTLTEQLAQPVVGGITTLNGRSTAGTVGGSGTGTASAVSTAPSSISGIVLPAGAQSINNLFGEILPVSISGLVFSDANNNGVQNPPADAGLSGVSIVLTGTDDLGSPVNRPLVTALDGSFSVADLRPGTYTLTQPTQPPGTTNGITTAGTAGGTATLPATTPSAISAIVLTTPGAASTGNLFAEIPDSGVISGHVWIDTNNDGVLQGTESGIGAQTIQLTGTETLGAAVSRSTLTAADGTFSFSGLAPGTYTLTQPAQPASTFNGQTVAGSLGGTATGVATTPSAISGIVLGALQSSLSNNFGEILGATVSGRVWLDANNDGLINGSEAGIAGQTIQLSGTTTLGGSVNRSVVTAADGSFSFTDLLPGSYALTQPAQPTGTFNGQTVAGTGGGTASGVAVTPSVISGIVLAAGQTAANNHFGEISGAQISGRVWFDANNDGLINGGESGIAAQTIQLTGTDSLGAAVARSTATAADGSYSFTDLLPGTYVLTQPAQPSGTFNGLTVAGTLGGTATAVTTTPSAISGIVLAAGQASLNNNFGETALGQISGRVWLDANHNGVIDGAETGIAGVTVNLSGTDSLGGSVSASAVTAADGSYSFGSLRPGNYTVSEPTQPAGTLNGQTVAGSAGGTATAPGATPSAISGIVLTSASPTSINNHFGEIPPAQLSGRVWTDANNDGVIGAGESGIAGVVLTLTGSNDLGASVSINATTAADGSYSFINLRPGTYTVTEPAQPPGTFNGRTNAGTAGGTATAVSVVPSAISGAVLTAGLSATGYDFGEITGAQISGRVWTDANNNGAIDAGEIGLSGVALNLSGTDDLGGAVTRSLVTGADGSYSFTNLRPGTYAVTEPTQPAGTLNGITVAGTAGGTATPVATLPSAITGIVLTAAQAATGNNFGEISGAQLAGRVWTDTNNNGVIDGGETGIAAVVINLSGTDDLGASVSRSTNTGADGSYSFTGLRPGSYTVTEPTQPAGTLNGRTVAGTAGGTATPIGTVPSAISGITLAVAQSATGNNFGEILAASLAGRVWGDANNDGVIGAGESGLAGVTIVLTGTNDLGATVNVSLVSAADGSYSFGDLRPGTYVLTQPTQPPGTSNGVTLAGTAGGAPTSVATTPSAISSIPLQAGTSATGYLFAEIPDSADLFVTKTHTKAAFTVGFTGTYQISVRNGGSQPTSASYTVQDRLPVGLTLASTPTGSGWSCTGAVGAGSFSCSSSAVIAAGASRADVITVVVNVAAAAHAQSPANNAVLVEGGGEVGARGPSPAERDAFLNNAAALPVCVAGITQNACRDPVPIQLAASVSGTVWTDGGSALRVLDAGDRRMPGWLVEVVDVASNGIVGRATTAANGSYRVAGLEPGIDLAVRFRDPASGVVFGYPVNGETAPGSSGATCHNPRPPAGSASSCPVAGATPQLVVVLASGAELTQQSLPIDPSGIVYDSVLRTPVAGSVVTLTPTGSCPGWNPSSSVVAATLGGYTVAGSSISMTVGPDGFYQFLLAPSAPASCTFGLSVTPPAGFTFVSTAIPPTAGPLVPSGAVGSVFAVQPQPAAPTGPAGPATAYYLSLTVGSGTASVVHNHIPVDPTAIGSVSLTKTGDRAVAEVGDTVRYTLTVRQAASGGRALQTTIVDRLPAGFTYIPGTAMVNDVPIADPAGGLGPTLVFNLGTMPVDRQLVLRYRARIGVGAQQGDGINRAQGHACNVAAGCVDSTLTPVSTASTTNRAEWRVRVAGGVFTTDACVLGKVFVDCNNNHVQDAEELGIPGVRLVLSDGTTLISDSEGKYSMCGLSPRSHVLRVDPSTLPRGSRMTTSSNRNLGDAGSLWLDLKNGELHRADFIEGSCSNTVLEQTKARRAQGEVRTVETEKKGGPALRFDSKAHELDTHRSPQQGTDGANQQAPKPRAVTPAAPSPAKDESHVPTPDLPMNQPPPRGRNPGQAPDSTTAANPAAGGSNGTR